MEWEKVYVSLAEKIALTVSDSPNEITYLYNCLCDIVDINSDHNASIDDFALEASVFLLPKIDVLYKQARQHYSYDMWRRNMVKSINDFTIKYFGNLTSFVINLSWTNSCIPKEWSDLSEEVHFDTSGWNICS